MKRVDFRDKLISKIFFDNSGCWNYTGGLNTGGYGQFFYKKPILAHIASYSLYIGQIPDGMKVCHKCDNRRCISPFHLFLGTQKDNVQDAISKGRFSIKLKTLSDEQNKINRKLSNIKFKKKAKEIRLQSKNIALCKNKNLICKKITEKEKIFSYYIFDGDIEISKGKTEISAWAKSLQGKL